MLDLLRETKAQQELLAQERSALEAAIKDKLGAAEVGTVGGQPVVTWKATSRIFLSQHEVKTRYPLIAKECSDIIEVRNFRLLAS